jgi:hypothetical protein
MAQLSEPDGTPNIIVSIDYAIEFAQTIPAGAGLPQRRLVMTNVIEMPK